MIAQSWKMRDEYYEIKRELAPKLSSDDRDLSLINPLSTDLKVIYTQNPWSLHFKHQEIKNTIKVDVERTLPDVITFKLDHNKQIIEDILFVWSVKHDIGYQQGFNEILAVILYVGLEEEETIDGLSSYEHIEADSYWIFDKILDLGVRHMYENSKEHWLENKLVNMSCIDKSKFDDTPELVKKSHFIFHRILSKIEPELYDHIRCYELEPQLIFVRWLRCLFSREFSIFDTVMIWDAVFACYSIGDKEFDLVNYICAAMLKSQHEKRKF